MVGLFNKEEKKKRIKKELYKENGSEIVDWTSWNWNFSTADVVIVEHENVTGDEVTDKDKDTAKDKAREKALEADRKSVV